MDIYCQVEAFPEPSIAWLKDQQQIFDNQRDHFITTYGSESGYLESKLRIAEIELNDYGVYTCKAINKLGHDKKLISLDGKNGFCLLSLYFSCYHLLSFATNKIQHL